MAAPSLPSNQINAGGIVVDSLPWCKEFVVKRHPLVVVGAAVLTVEELVPLWAGGGRARSHDDL